MATQYHESGQLPDGVVLAHTLHGEPDASVTLAYVASAAAGVELIPAPYDGIPYYEDDVPAVYAQAVELLPEPIPESIPSPVQEQVGPRPPERDRHCHAKNDTCMGWAIKDSNLCAAHAGLFRGPGRMDRDTWLAQQAAREPEQP